MGCREIRRQTWDMEDKPLRRYEINRQASMVGVVIVSNYGADRLADKAADDFGLVSAMSNAPAAGRTRTRQIQSHMAAVVKH